MVPQWLAEHPCFRGHADRLMQEFTHLRSEGHLCGQQEEEDQLNMIKVQLHEVARISLLELQEGPAGSVQEALHRAMAAFRAWRDGKFSRAWKLVAHDSALRRWFHEDGMVQDVEGCGRHIASLMRQHLQALQDAVNGEGDERRSKQAFSKIAMISKAWREKHRVVGLTAIIDPHEQGDAADGDEPQEPAGVDQVEQASAYLRQYWGSVCTKKRTLKQAQDVLLRQVHTINHSDLDWNVNSPTLLQALQNRRNRHLGQMACHTLRLQWEEVL